MKITTMHQQMVLVGERRMMVIVVTVCYAAEAGIILQVPYAHPIARIVLEANETIYTAFVFPAAAAPSIKNSPPVEGCQAPPDGVVVEVLHQSILSLPNHSFTNQMIYTIKYLA